MTKGGDTMAKTKTTSQLLVSLKTALTGRDLGNFDDAFLLTEIELAIGEVNRCRRFTPKNDVLYDAKYEYIIVPMCIASLSKIGAEGQTRHSENGIDRQYGGDGNYPASLTRQIIPLIK